jgi:hypothetical protein
MNTIVSTGFFCAEACDDLGGEFCGAEYQRGVYYKRLQERCPEKLGRFLSSFSVFECIYIIINSRMTLVHNTCKFIYICLLIRPFLLEKSVSVISMTSCMQV